jgi:hypothetical protein
VGGVFEKIFAGAIFKAHLYYVERLRVANARCRNPIVSIMPVAATRGTAAVGAAAGYGVFTG